MEKAFKVTITPQDEDYIAKHGDKVVELESDIVFLATENKACVQTAGTAGQIAEALCILENIANEVKRKDSKIPIALEVVKLRKKFSELLEDDD